LEIFEDSTWQMSLGERAAVEGVLCQLRPSLAIEIGSAEGACVLRIAAHADSVHSFDLDPPTLPMPQNVIPHVGDSHELLPTFLAELAEAERNVDLVIVDGDHSPEGVRRDLEDLLDSPAVARTLILIHDTTNERVRAGVEAVHFAAWPKVAHVELDWIPGQLFAEPALHNELWYGLGLVAVDVRRPAYLNGSRYEQRYHPAGPLMAHARDLVEAREHGGQAVADTIEERASGLEATLARTQAELAAANERIGRADRVIEDLQSSASWRITAPLRAAKRRVRTAVD
jgi:hypothetical protein